MYFESQAAYEHYHSPDQRRVRCERAAKEVEHAVTEALALHEAGDEDSARQRLFDAGIQDEGIAYYMQSWQS